MACKLGVACYHKDLESTGLQHFRCCCVGLTYDNIRNQRDQKITFICKLQIYAVMIGSGGSRQETLIHRARARMKTPIPSECFSCDHGSNFQKSWCKAMKRLGSKRVYIVPIKLVSQRVRCKQRQVASGDVRVQ